MLMIILMISPSKLNTHKLRNEKATTFHVDDGNISHIFHFNGRDWLNPGLFN